MLDKFLALLERFVLAHEILADAAQAQAGKGVSVQPILGGEEEKSAKELPVEGEDVIDTKPAKKDDTVEDDLSDDEPEEKPKTRKPRATKAKAEPEPDLAKLREEIEVMAKHIGSGDSDDCADELDDLLDEYDARSVKKLKDLQVQEFHNELKAIVAKYYDIED